MSASIARVGKHLGKSSTALCVNASIAVTQGKESTVTDTLQNLFR